MGEINNFVKYTVMVASAIFLFYAQAYAASGDVSMGKFLSEEKQRQWEAAQSKLAYDYGVCLEHCGGDETCINKCEKTYRSRLDMAFNSISHEPDDVFGQTDIITHPSCSYCGMDRAKFAHSRVYILYDDGSSFGACSIHCAAVELAANIEKSPVSIQVGDYNTWKLMDAENAYWVIGGSKAGVMTKRAKWAFENKKDADDFIAQNGGETATFEQAIEASYEDMYQDTKMIHQKRKKTGM